MQAIEARGGAVQVHTVADPGAVEEPQVRRWESTSFWAYPQLRIALPSRRQVLQAVAEWEPTPIHATTPFGVGLAGRHAARTLGVPLVTSYHTSFADYLRHYHLQALDAVARPYLRWFHNSGQRTFAPSGAVADELRAHRFESVRIWGRGLIRCGSIRVSAPT